MRSPGGACDSPARVEVSATRQWLGIAIAAAIIAALVGFFAMRRPPPSTTAATPTPPGEPPRVARAPFDERDRANADAPLEGNPVPDSPVPTPASATTEAPAERPDDPDAPPAAAPPLPSGSPTWAHAHEQAIGAAKEALDAVHTTMRRKCWDPLADKPDAVEIAFSLSYDAGGKVIASAVQQGREGSSVALGECLAPFAHALTIEPPGEGVSVEVSFELP